MNIHTARSSCSSRYIASQRFQLCKVPVYLKQPCLFAKSRHVFLRIAGYVNDSISYLRRVATSVEELLINFNESPTPPLEKSSPRNFESDIFHLVLTIPTEIFSHEPLSENLSSISIKFFHSFISVNEHCQF